MGNGGYRSNSTATAERAVMMIIGSAISVTGGVPSARPISMAVARTRFNGMRMERTRWDRAERFMDYDCRATETALTILLTSTTTATETMFTPLLNANDASTRTMAITTFTVPRT